MRRWWWLSLAAFFLMGAAWAVALPANGTYDEKDHIARAYAVATGQLTAHHTIINRRGDATPAFLAPASLLPSAATVDCTWSPRPPKPASCQRWTASRGKILTQSAAARYSPVYYLPAGVPLVLDPDLTGIVLARLVSVALSALLLACAVGAALRLGGRLFPVAIMLTATPLAMNLSGSVNPNGLEISAGVLVFSSLLALLRAPDDRLDDRAVRRLVASACLGSVLLLTLRELGPVLLALDVGACALLARPGRLAALWRRRDARWALGACWIAGLLLAAGWLKYSGFANIASNSRDAIHLPLSRELDLIATHRIPFYFRQVIGEFSYGETVVSPYMIIGWYLLVAAVVVPCGWYAGWRHVCVLAALGVLCLTLLVVMELRFMPRIGWFSQGRYALPALVGVVLGAASADGFGRRLSARGWLPWYPAVLAAGATTLHVYALCRLLTRFDSGVAASLNPFPGSWHPSLGPVPPLVALFAGSALLTVVVTVAPQWGAAAGPAFPARRCGAVPATSV